MRSSTIGNDNAKLVRYAVDPQRGVIVELVREWDHMDARTSKTSVDGMSTTGPVINPQASSLTYSGTWYRAKPTNAVESDLRGVVVTETLVPTVGASTTWQYAVNCGEDRLVVLKEDLTSAAVTTLLQDYAEPNQGHYYMVDVERSQQSGLFNVRVTDRQAVSHTQAKFTSKTSTDEVETTERKFNQTSPTGWTSSTQGVVVTLESQKNETCTYDNTERSKTSTERVLANHTVTNSAGMTETRSKTYNDREVPATPSTTKGVIGTVRSEQNADGTYDNDSVSRTSVELATSGTSVAIGFTEANSTTHNARTVPSASGTGTVGTIVSIDATPNEDGTANVKQVTRVNKEISATSDADADGYSESHTSTKSTTTVPSATSSTGVIVSVDATPNEDGTKDVRVTSRSSKEQTASGTGIATGYDESTTNIKNSTTAPSLPTTGIGIIATVDSRKNEDGTVDSRVTSRSNKEISADSAASAEAYSESHTVTKSTTTVPSATSSAGIIMSVDATPNEDGTKDVRVTSKSSNEQTSYGDADADGYSESSTHKKSTTTALSATAAATTGVIATADNRKNDDGTLDSNLTLRTSKSQSASGTESADAYDVSSTNYKNWMAEVDVPSGGVGIIASVDNKKNDDGTFDARTTSKSSKEQSSTGNASSSGYDESTTHVKSATTELSATPGGIGVINTADNRKNDDGTIDGTLTSRSSKPMEASGSSDATLETTSTTRYKSQTAEISVPSGGTGVIVEADSTPNDDGTFDGTAKSTSSKSAEWSESLDAMGQSVTTSKTKNGGAITTSTTATAGVIVRTASTINTDGTFDGEVQTTSAKELSASTTYGSVLHDSSRTVISSATTAPTGDTSTTGVVTSVSVSNNVDGTVDGVVESTSAKYYSSSRFLAENTGKRRDYVTLFANSTTIPTLSSTLFGAVSAHINEDGTYSGQETSTSYYAAGSWDSGVDKVTTVKSIILRDNDGQTQSRTMTTSRTAQHFGSWGDCYDFISDCETMGYEAKMPIQISSGMYVGMVETITSYGTWANI